MMRLLAEVIAEFHSEAEIVGECSGAADIRNAIENNSAILRESIDRPFERKLVEQYCDKSLLFHARISALLEQRRKQGCVRRCHGDLHLNNIFMFEGRPTLFDGIEFNDAFSCIDVLYDLAFLLMDLDRHRLRNLANTILNRYLELSPQHAGLAALPLFISCRAAIRAHTAVAAAEAISGGAPATTLVMDAAALLRHAVDALSMPRARLIAVGGISGTGKSTLARDLAPGLGPVPGAIVIRSDIIRKQLMRVPETVRLPQEAYASAVTERVYRRIEELAHTCLMAGYPVIADAVYGTEVERQGIAQIAKTLDVSFAGLWLHAPTDVLEARLGKRQGDASDATIKVCTTNSNLLKLLWAGLVSPLRPLRPILSRSQANR
jgi:predicted kinase